VRERLQTLCRAEVAYVEQFVFCCSRSVADPARHTQVPELVCVGFQVLGHALEKSNEVFEPGRKETKRVIDAHTNEKDNNVTASWPTVGLALLVDVLR